MLFVVCVVPPARARTREGTGRDQLLVGRALLEAADGPNTRNRRGTPSPADVAEIVSRHLDPHGRFLVRSRAVTVSPHGTDPWEGTLEAVLMLPADLVLPLRLEATTAAGRRVRLNMRGPVSGEAAQELLTGRQ